MLGNRTIVVCSLVVWLGFAGAQAVPESASPQGTFEVFEVPSPQLQATREVVVYLPPGYDGAARSYPVVVLQDGQNVFSRRPFAGRLLPVPEGRSWTADLAADRVAEAGRPVVLVAVPSTGLRAADYLPFEITENVGTGPRAEAYVDFLADTVLPFVRERFAIRSEPPAIAVVGSSHGGIVSLVAGFRRPDTFGFVGSLSPSLDAGDYGFERWLDDHPASGLVVYVDVGTLETSLSRTELQTAIDGVVARFEALGNRAEGLVVEGAGHNEAAWAARLPGVLARFLDELEARD